ncbi:MAG: NADH-quinone oxidoreductase subunit NuoN [Rhizobiales bacterium]|nr:NADH-quinone oxidoreductase subunit NuoN [Hyphomicrobiales bacterium]
MSPDTMTLASFLPALPEIILAIGILVLLLVGAVAGQRATALVTGLAVVTIVISGVVLVLSPASGVAFSGSFILDGFARLMKLLALIGSAVAIIVSVGFLRAQKIDSFEYPVLILIATLGMLLMISANDLIAAYIGIELHSLALYVLTAFSRKSVRSTEAGLKYFVLGALASGMLLYGASLIYGFTGQVTFSGIAAALHGEAPSVGLVFGLVFLIVGLAFKVSAVPFHMWTPDVYEGSPTAVTAFLAGAPKLAAMALFIRAIVVPFAPITHDWQQVIVFISIASMVLGAFAAIGQQNIKRMMAYSAIGHMGYALVGLAAGTATGVQGTILYMLIYMVMAIGTFVAILAMKRQGVMVEGINDLAGLAKTHPLMAFMLAMLLFSLAGIPPLAGFFAKFYVFIAAVQAGLYALAVIGVLASVVGAYYYLRIVKIMYFDDPAPKLDPVAPELGAVLGLSGIFMIVFVVIAGPIGSAAELAAKTLF